MISSVLEHALLGIHGDTAVIAHMLMASGGDIEKRGLSAIGISHQGDLYHLAALFGQCSHLPFKPGLVTGLQCRQGLTSRQELLCFSLTDNLDLGRFLMAK